MANVEYNNIVTQPVVLVAVSKLIGAPNIKDTGTLCTSDKINKWARYKPVNCTEIFPTITFVSNDPTKDGHWRTVDKTLIGGDYKYVYGMDVYGMNNDVMTANTIYSTSNMKHWNYVGRVPYRRLDDFINYNHKCDPLLQTQGFEYINGVTSEQKIYVSSTASSSSAKALSTLRFVAFCSTSQYGITINEIAHLIGGYSGSTQHIALVAHFYKGGACIASYFANGIKLGTNGQQTEITDFDFCDGYGNNNVTSCRWLYAECTPDYDTFDWNVNSGAETLYTVYLTLDCVKYNADDDKWESTKRLEIPKDNNHWFCKTIKIALVARFFAPSQIYTGTRWANYYERFNSFEYAKSAAISVKTIKVPGEDLDIYSYNSSELGKNGGWVVMSKVTINGVTCVDYAYVTDSSRKVITKQNIPKSGSEGITDVYVYLQFGNIFEGKFDKGTLENLGIHSVNPYLYLAFRDTNGSITQTKDMQCCIPIIW